VTVEDKWWTLVAVCVGTFMLLLDVTIVIVALPDIQHGLKATFGDVQWVVDAYALTLASLLLTAGVLADRYGRRLLFIVGLVIFTAGSLLCGLAQSPLMLILSRSGQGIGGAIMFATSLALLGNSFRGKDRGVAFGVWGAITGVAVSVGPILGGVITTELSWRWIFLVNVPVGVIGVVITAIKVAESKVPEPGKPDWPGFAFLTTGLVGLVYALIRASETSWSDSGVWISLATGVVLLVAFVVTETRVADPMFDLHLFRTPTFVGGLLAAFAMNASLFSMLLYLVIYLQDELGYSALQAGLRLLVNSGALFVAAAAAGRLSERVPVRWLIGPGLLLVGLGLLLMGNLSGASTWTHLIPGFIIGGFGAGLVNPPLASTAIGVVTPERAGMASGINATFRQVGIATSIAALGTIFTSAVQRNIAPAIDQSFRSAFGPRPGAGIVGAEQTVVAHVPQILAAVRQGQGGAPAGVPASVRPVIESAVRSAFVGGINDLLIVTAAVAFFGALSALFLIRSRDFVARGGPAAAH
jgi:EmrB/QacA subfamily drug resistance transporter